MTLTIFFGHGAYAQRACLSKLSPMLRHYVLEEREKEKQTVNLAKKHDVKAKKTITGIPSPMTTAFIKVSGDGKKVLHQHGGKIWARYGNIIHRYDSAELCIPSISITRDTTHRSQHEAEMYFRFCHHSDQCFTRI